MSELTLHLQTHSSFLATHFKKTKLALVGHVPHATTPEENLIVQPIFNRTFHISARQKALSMILSVVIGLACTIGCILLIPSLYYLIFPAEVVEISATESGTAFGGSFEETVPAEIQEYQPPVDPSLPVGEWVVIPRIGVRTQPLATLDPEEALKTGVWRVPDFGIPGEKTVIDGREIKLPIILAAHRYGWQWWWQTDYWKYHSFYELPTTQPGDRIEIISNQRKWVYEIYSGEEGEQITDYSADLILYTCKFLNSPIRHFRYARLVDPTVDTQQLNTTAP